jgi:hypothetical protein
MLSSATGTLADLLLRRPAHSVIIRMIREDHMNETSLSFVWAVIQNPRHDLDGHEKSPLSVEDREPRMQ